MNCVDMRTIYERIEAKLATPPTDIQVFRHGMPFENYEVPSVKLESNVHIHNFSHRFISEMLTEHRVSHFSANTPVFISAQTGAGKTQFAFHVMYPIIKARRQKLLVFASRSALKQKVKYDAIKAAETGQDELLTPKGIEKEHIFGDIEVFSYQDLEYESKRNYILKRLKCCGYYGAAIMDECHFFVADADFNRLTADVLHFLVKQLVTANILRVYMTGTPRLVFDPILDLERACCTHGDFHMKMYHFRRDYSYIEPFFFPSDDYLLNIINRVSGVKWLIFVDSKAKANELMEKLDTSNKFFLSADTTPAEKWENPSIRSMIEHGKLNFDVLIATKCLDVGVTILSSNVNIVSYLKDEVDFLQTIGRKRVKSNEHVNLFIPLYDAKVITREISRCMFAIDDIEKAMKWYPKGHVAVGYEFPAPIYVKNGKYDLNNLAILKLRSKLSALEKIAKKIQSTNMPSEIISRYILSWIGLDDRYTETMILQHKESSKLEQIIEKYRHQIMNSGEFKQFCEELSPYDPRADLRKDRKLLTVQTVNTIFKKNNIPLKISHKNKNNVHSFHVEPVEKEERK